MKKIVIIALMLFFLITLTAFAARFTDNGDGTVTDTVTGFMWQKEDDNTPVPWHSALSLCWDLSLASYTDWRLPNIKELRSIVDNSKIGPAIDESVFPNTKITDFYPVIYHSSTTYAKDPAQAWAVLFGDGAVGFGDKEYFGYFRCVRGGE